MPLYKTKVEIRDGKLCCKHCHKPADESTTTDEKDKPLYELMCPGGTETLGSWKSKKELQSDRIKYVKAATKKQARKRR
ncbi:MAG TPA: hypothetical protein VF011_02810 [Terriglobales bacterium]